MSNMKKSKNKQTIKISDTHTLVKSENLVQTEQTEKIQIEILCTCACDRIDITLPVIGQYASTEINGFFAGLSLFSWLAITSRFGA